MNDDGQQPALRENPEPREAHHPVPIAIIALVCLLLGWAGGYMMGASPNAAPELGDQRTPPAVASAVAAAPPVQAAIDGAQLYSTHCMACHQATGGGLPQVFPPLAGSEWVQGDPAVLVQILLHGVSGPIEVGGHTYSGAMPPFGQTLDDAELAALASHLRSQWGNQAPPVSAAEVGKARARTESRSTPWNGGAELSALAD